MGKKKHLDSKKASGEEIGNEILSGENFSTNDQMTEYGQSQFVNVSFFGNGVQVDC